MTNVKPKDELVFRYSNTVIGTHSLYAEPNERQSENPEETLSRIEKTAYSQADNENSAWSKSWLLQGTVNRGNL